jgi:hypothetical protein
VILVLPLLVLLLWIGAEWLPRAEWLWLLVLLIATVVIVRLVQHHSAHPPRG